MTTVESEAGRTSWPWKPYFGALLFALVSLLLLTPALDGRPMNDARLLAQVAICGLLGGRFAWAAYQRERNKVWIGYVVAMLLAAPIWLLVLEPLVFAVKAATR